jgi:4,5-DOPA dioxygenase extradiol
MHALHAGAAGEAWAALAARLPRPRAIVIASAHWESAAPSLTGAARPETIHDFFGFPQPLYSIRYRCGGAPGIAERARALLQGAGLDALVDARRGLDHGAWSPLLHLYPQGDVPVVQISVQSALGTRHHVAVGRALAPLAAENILIIGSGHMTHNLRDRLADAAPPVAYAVEFQAWTDAAIRAHDLDALENYRTRSPHGARAHPTEEHFLPLFLALGAAAPEYRAERVYDGIESGVLAMDAYCLHPH